MDPGALLVLDPGSLPDPVALPLDPLVQPLGEGRGDPKGGTMDLLGNILRLVLGLLEGGSVSSTFPHLDLRWSITIPSYDGHVFHGDVTTGSVFMSDGFVTPASHRIRRFDAATGKELASVRTRHQMGFGMATLNGHLFATTDSRLFELDAETLVVVREWGKGLVRYANQIVVTESHVVQANWLKPTIAVIARGSDVIRRIKVGPQPVIVGHDSGVLAIAGFDGGAGALDLNRMTLMNARPMQPVVLAAGGRDVWAVIGGAPEPPAVSPREVAESLPPIRRGTNTLVRLTGDAQSVELPGVCKRVWVDDARGVVWCVGVGANPIFSIRAWAVNQQTSHLVAAFESETNASLPWQDPELHMVARAIVHIDPALNVVLIRQLHSRTHVEPHVGAQLVTASTSTLSCYELPPIGN